MGRFDADYLARFSVAVVERAGRIQAFANLWQGPNKEELSIDLMRYTTRRRRRRWRRCSCT